MFTVVAVLGTAEVVGAICALKRHVVAGCKNSPNLLAKTCVIHSVPRLVGARIEKGVGKVAKLEVVKQLPVVL